MKSSMHSNTCTIPAFSSQVRRYGSNRQMPPSRFELQKRGTPPSLQRGRSVSLAQLEIPKTFLDFLVKVHGAHLVMRQLWFVSVPCFRTHMAIGWPTTKDKKYWSFLQHLASRSFMSGVGEGALFWP